MAPAAPGPARTGRSSSHAVGQAATPDASTAAWPCDGSAAALPSSSVLRSSALKCEKWELLRMAVGALGGAGNMTVRSAKRVDFSTRLDHTRSQRLGWLIQKARTACRAL